MTRKNFATEVDRHGRRDEVQALTRALAADPWEPAALAALIDLFEELCGWVPDVYRRSYDRLTRPRQHAYLVRRVARLRLPDGGTLSQESWSPVTSNQVPVFMHRAHAEGRYAAMCQAEDGNFRLRAFYAAQSGGRSENFPEVTRLAVSLYSKDGPEPLGTTHFNLKYYQIPFDADADAGH